MATKLTYPSTRPRPHPAGQQAWSIDVRKDSDSAINDIQANICDRIETSSCGPLFGSSSWHPSVLALDPPSGRLYVAEVGLPRVKVFDVNGKYLQGFAMSGGVEAMCVVPGESLVIVVTEEVIVSKMLGMKKEQHRITNCVVKPFLDFKPGFEFVVKSKYAVDKKASSPRFSLTHDPVGSCFIIADSTSPSLKAFKAENGSSLWQKPKITTQEPSKKSKSIPQTSNSLLHPTAIAIDSSQNILVCDTPSDNNHQPAVKVFDNAVKLMYLLGEGRGNGDKNMLHPSGIVLTDNEVIISDCGRNCLSAYSRDARGMSSMAWLYTVVINGEPLKRQVANAPPIEGPVAIVAGHGYFWVAYPNIATVFKISWTR